MSTRGAVRVSLDGEKIITLFNHWDSYPKGLGEDLKDFIRKVDLDKFITSLKSAKERISNSLDEERDEGEGDVLYYLANPDRIDYSLESENFIADTLFCEWWYELNIYSDDNSYEVVTHENLYKEA